MSRSTPHLTVPMTHTGTPQTPKISRRIALAATGSALLLGPGCDFGGASPEVVVYTAHDSIFSRPILDRFSSTTGIDVRPKFDVESSKTVGLVNAIMAESNRPRCDVFWNNEILNTLRLQQQGLLQEHKSPAAEPYPQMYKDPQGRWYGFGARARILIYNTQMVAPSERPESIYDLASPQWKGKTGIAEPLFGTTATHSVCLFSTLGEQPAKEFFASLKDNQIQIMAGNKAVAEGVANGGLAFGLTDTDDALQMIDQGYPVEIIYPDQQSDQLGTLFIPNTVCIIQGAPHGPQARQLVDYLLSPQVERDLAQGPAGQIPLNPQVDVETRVATPDTVRAMDVDFHQAVDHWEAASQYLANRFLGRA